MAGGPFGVHGERQGDRNQHRRGAVGLAGAPVADVRVPEKEQDSARLAGEVAVQAAPESEEGCRRGSDGDEVQQANAPHRPAEESLGEGVGVVGQRALLLPRVPVGHPAVENCIADPGEDALVATHRPPQRADGPGHDQEPDDDANQARQQQRRSHPWHYGGWLRRRATVVSSLNGAVFLRGARLTRRANLVQCACGLIDDSIGAREMDRWLDSLSQSTSKD